MNAALARRQAAGGTTGQQREGDERGQHYGAGPGSDGVASDAIRHPFSVRLSSYSNVETCLLPVLPRGWPLKDVLVMQ